MKGFRVRSTIFGALYTILLLLLLVILVLLADTLALRVDLTDTGMYTLSDQTREVLSELDGPVGLFLVSRPGQENLSILSLLERYERHEGITLEILDGEREAARISYLLGLDTGYSADGLPQNSVIIQYGQKTRVLAASEFYKIAYDDSGSPTPYGFTAERMISSAVWVLSQGGEQILYQLTGHGELSLAAMGLAERFEQSGFRVKDLSLTKQAQVPLDASLLLIISAEKDLTERERDLLERYLNSGGHLVIAIDHSPSEREHLKELLFTMGVELLEGIVMELDSSRQLPVFSNSPVAFLPVRVEAAVPEDFELVFLQSTGFAQLSGHRESTYKTLLSSSGSSLLRRDLSRSELSLVQGDIKGPIDVAVKTEFDSGGKLVLLGSGLSFSALPRIGQIEGNTQLLLSLVTDLLPGPAPPTFEDKSLVDLPLLIPSSAVFILGALCSFILPLLVLVTGLLIKRARERS